MDKDRTKQYLAYGAGILVLCLLFAWNDLRAVAAAKARNEAQKQAAVTGGADSDDSSAPSKSGKSAPRATAPKPASDKEQEKFRRFFLPPIKLENATIEEAVAAIIAAYRETAAATGETAQDLSVETAAARTRKPITCLTPRAPAGTVLRYVAAMAGNSTKGSLPNFRLEALSDVADRDGKIQVSPGWPGELARFEASLNQAPEAKLPEDPFAKSPSAEVPASNDPFSGNPPQVLKLRDLLLSLGFNPALEANHIGSSFSYENMSEAEQEWLAALVETTGHVGAAELKTNTKIVLLPDDLAESLNSGSALSDGEVQLSMRTFAQRKGVDLMTLPSIIARQGEVRVTEIDNSSPTADVWTGLKMATVAVPYGLGSQVEFALKLREESGTESSAREQITLPENGSGVAISSWQDGKKVVVIQGNTLIDATGAPIAPHP